MTEGAIFQIATHHANAMDSLATACGMSAEINFKTDFN